MVLFEAVQHCWTLRVLECVVGVPLPVARASPSAVASLWCAVSRATALARLERSRRPSRCRAPGACGCSSASWRSHWSSCLGGACAHRLGCVCVCVSCSLANNGIDASGATLIADALSYNWGLRVLKCA